MVKAESSARALVSLVSRVSYNSASQSQSRTPLTDKALKWFPAGSSEPVDYNSGRDLDSLVNLYACVHSPNSHDCSLITPSVTKESKIKSSIKPPAPPAAIQLDASNFDDIALDNTKDVLVSFTAPWVGASLSLTISQGLEH